MSNIKESIIHVLKDESSGASPGTLFVAGTVLLIIAAIYYFIK